MSLTPGSRVGHYEIVGPIGAGGRNTRVARKILPAPFARERFPIGTAAPGIALVRNWAAGIGK